MHDPVIGLPVQYVHDDGVVYPASILALATPDKLATVEVPGEKGKPEKLAILGLAHQGHDVTLKHVVRDETGDSCPSWHDLREADPIVSVHAPVVAPDPAPVTK